VLNADTNEAFSLLLRYPSLPEPQKPTSLVRDALKLHDSLTQETGQTIVFKRTGRKISRASLATPLRLSKHGPSQSHLSVPSPASLETILHGAARGVMSRSERWGLNQALRDVLGEVRRNVKTVQASGGNTSPGRSSSVESARSTKNRTISHSTIAANALRRINALEARNKMLGQMLHRATLDIAQVVKELEENQTTKDQAEKLGSAASKVETVHAFLNDITLPLPEENPASEASPSKASLPDDLPKTDAGDKAKYTATSPELPDTPGRQKSPGGSQSQPKAVKVNERESSTSSRLGSSAATKKSTSTSASPLVKPRPHITESPLSWMLAGNEDRGEIGKPSFLTPATLTQRHSRNQSAGSESRSGKGYLFGDMNDSDTTDQQKHDARTRSETRKGAMEDISLEDVRGTEANRGRAEPRADGTHEPAGH
jgi:TBC1 domain family protein 5